MVSSPSSSARIEAATRHPRPRRSRTCGRSADAAPRRPARRRTARPRARCPRREGAASPRGAFRETRRRAPPRAPPRAPTACPRSWAPLLVGRAPSRLRGGDVGKTFSLTKNQACEIITRSHAKAKLPASQNARTTALSVLFRPRVRRRTCTLLATTNKPDTS